MFAVYGVAAATAGALFRGAGRRAGTTSGDVDGPLSWGLFEILFLIFGIPDANYPMMVVAYGLRGFGYPLFAYGFLVWIAATTSLKRLGFSGRLVLVRIYRRVANARFLAGQLLRSVDRPIRHTLVFTWHLF